MRRIDNIAIKSYGIPSPVLMENAGNQVFLAIRANVNEYRQKKYAVVCGKGNNAGDGFVIARKLKDDSCDVKLIMLSKPADLSTDASLNFNIAKKLNIHSIECLGTKHLAQTRNLIKNSNVIVDAIFGTGIKGSVTGYAGDVIEIINRAKKCVISVDVPSGLDADEGRVFGPVIKADITVTFGHPKTGLFVYPGAEFAGRTILADIGIPKEIIKKEKVKSELIDPELIRSILPERKPNTHKGNYGRVLILAGSADYTGASVLCARGCAGVGAGLITVLVPEKIYPVVAKKLTQQIVVPLPTGENKFHSIDAFNEIEKYLSRCDALAIGPGLGQKKETQELIIKILQIYKKPMVIDADGLNIISENASRIKKLNPNIAITPHPGELSRLLKTDTTEIQNNRLNSALKSSNIFNCATVLKGQNTIITDSNGKFSINPTGNSGMAKGGMGDILTGMIAGFIGYGMSIYDACRLGVYLHGLAGDLAKEKYSDYSFTTEDLIDNIPDAFSRIPLL